jgi:DsbC/DsbD-like thiol-disulfide interchange protein
MDPLRRCHLTDGWLPALILLNLLLVAFPAVAADAPPAVPLAAEAVLTGEGVFTVLWHLTPTVPWHIYSDRLNDSGYPPSLQVSWPEGWQAGELLWPVAERHLLDGIILDHVYHGTVTLVQEVRAPVQAFADGPVTVPARWDWLACHGMCVPGKTEGRVVFDPRQTAGGHALSAARALLPRPLEGDAVAVCWGEGLVSFTAAGAASLEFHPAGDGPGVHFVDLAAEGAAQGEELTLHLRSANDGSGALRGTLLINHDDGPATIWAVDIPYGGK